MRRFAALSSKRRRRQIGAIGFDHEFPEWDFCRDLSHGHAIFESDNSGKRNEGIEIEDMICLTECATEAMKNTSHFACVLAQDFKRVLPRIALMNYNVQPKLDR